MATVDPDPSVLERPDGLKYLSPHREAAWLGLLRAHSELTRQLDCHLQAGHNLSLTTYEVLSRLAHAEEGRLRVSDIAGLCGLSLSRVSRVIDDLERRRLVGRTSCPTDSRAVHVVIHADGRKLISQAQDTFFSVMEERFLGRLSCDEVSQLADLLGRLGPSGPGHP